MALTTKIGNLEDIQDLRGQLLQRAAYPWRELGDIHYLVIHHTGVESPSTPLSIARYHVQTLDWPGIGYHFFIYRDGRIAYVGDILQLRYNVARRNPEVIGICIDGNFMGHPPTQQQIQAAHHLCANLQFALGWFVPTVGHKEIALPGYGTACPGNTWDPSQGEGWRASIITEAPGDNNPSQGEGSMGEG